MKKSIVLASILLAVWTLATSVGDVEDMWNPNAWLWTGARWICARWPYWVGAIGILAGLSVILWAERARYAERLESVTAQAEMSTHRIARLRLLEHHLAVVGELRERESKAWETAQQSHFTTMRRGEPGRDRGKEQWMQQIAWIAGQLKEHLRIDINLQGVATDVESAPNEENIADSTDRARYRKAYHQHTNVQRYLQDLFQEVRQEAGNIEYEVRRMGEMRPRVM